MSLTLNSGEKSSYLLINASYDEDNTSEEGFSVTDNYPDFVAGDRIVPTDENLDKASLNLRGQGRARWKLFFPPQIKVWRKVQGKYQQILSGVAAAETKLPQTIPLLIEGIQESRTDDDASLKAILTTPGTGQSVADTILYTVHSGGGRIASSGGGSTSPPAKVNPWSNWPNCVPSTWAEDRAKSQKPTQRQARPEGGNGLPVVVVASPSLGEVLGDLTTVSGTAIPGVNNRTIKRIEFSLHHYSPTSKMAGYWDGSQWQARPTATPMLLAVFRNGQWQLQAHLPTGRNLASGSYSLEVRAYDNFDQWGYTRRRFSVDKNPRLTITAPAAKSIIAGFNDVAGTVTPGAPESTITEVKVRVTRSINLKSGMRPEFWSGSAWVPEPTAPQSAIYRKPGGSQAEGNWHLLKPFPPDMELSEGRYHVTVAATDDAGNRGCTTSEFLVGREPKLTVTSPTGRATVPALPLIQGTVELIAGGTPVTEVRVQLWRRGAKSEYWDGKGWNLPPTSSTPVPSSVPSSASLAAVYTPPTAPHGTGAWEVKRGLPAEGDLVDGHYLFTVQAYNGAVCVAQQMGGFQIYRGPNINITWPVQGETVSSLDAAQPVHGTARPGVVGIPIAFIVLSLTRFKATGGAEIWDGTAWVAVPPPVKALETQWTAPAVPTVAGRWRRNFGWPSAQELAEGAYFLSAAVTDVAGKGTQAHVNFYVRRK